MPYDTAREVARLEDTLLRFVPERQWEIQSVTFPAVAGVDFDIIHGLTPRDPELVRYLVIQAGEPCMVYQDATPTRIAWTKGLMRLRCTQGSAHVVLLLWVADAAQTSRLDPSATFSFSTSLSALGALATADGNIIVGDGSTWVVGNGGTARASPGGTIGTQVQADSAPLDTVAAGTYAGDDSIVTVGTIGTGTWNAAVIADGKIASALTGKTYNALTLVAAATGFTIAGGTTSKTLTVPLDASVSGTNTGDNAANSTYTIGSQTQAWDANLDAIAALSDADSNIIVGSAGGWVAESGATARTSLR